MPMLTDALESILEDWRAHSKRYAEQAEYEANHRLGNPAKADVYYARQRLTDDHIMRIAIALKEDTRP